MPGEVAEFPLPADVTAEERETAKREIAKHAKVIEVQPRVVRFEGREIGKTGPVWHLQYTRLYALEDGYLVAAHDLHEGIKVAHAKTPGELPDAFENPLVREFLEDELRFRNVMGSERPEHAARPEQQ